MILIISKKKKRLVMKAISNTILMCTTNQNGKTTFNNKAGNAIGLTLKDLEKLVQIGHVFRKKIEGKKQKKAKMEVTK